MTSPLKIDRETCDRLDDIAELITRRNELVEARAVSHTAAFSYENVRGEARLYIDLEKDDQQKVKEWFTLVVDDELRKIDVQLRELGLGSLIGE